MNLKCFFDVEEEVGAVSVDGVTVFFQCQVFLMIMEE